MSGARDRGLAPDTVRHQEPAHAMLKCAVERRVFLVGANPCAVERRTFLAGANPARQLSLQPVVSRAVHGGNDMY